MSKGWSWVINLLSYCQTWCDRGNTPTSLNWVLKHSQWLAGMVQQALQQYIVSQEVIWIVIFCLPSFIEIKKCKLHCQRPNSIHVERSVWKDHLKWSLHWSLVGAELLYVNKSKTHQMHSLTCRWAFSDSKDRCTDSLHYPFALSHFFTCACCLLLRCSGFEQITHFFTITFTFWPFLSKNLFCYTSFASCVLLTKHSLYVS